MKNTATTIAKSTTMSFQGNKQSDKKVAKETFTTKVEPVETVKSNVKVSSETNKQKGKNWEGG